MNAPKHNPSFHWRHNVIYDGEIVVACFCHDPDGKSPIAFSDVRLSPQGEPLVHWTLSWHYGSFCATSKLSSLDVRNVGPEKLLVAFDASTPSDDYASHTEIELVFDETRGCYRFMVETTLQATRFPYASWNEIDSVGYHQRLAFFPAEFANFVPLNSYCHYAPFDSTVKKWQAFAYRDAAGAWREVPQHHLNTPDKYNIRFHELPTKLGFVHDPGGNPCVELMESVPAGVRGGICWSMNDVHLQVCHFDLNFRHRVRYALYQFTNAEAADIRSIAVGSVYAPEEVEWYDRPRFANDRTCNFEQGFNLEETDDCFQFWLPMGSVVHTTWSRDEGRGGGRCLKNSTPRPERVFWQTEGTNASVVPKNQKYCVTCWAKVRELSGEAYLEVWDMNNPARTIASERLCGTKDWCRLSAEVEMPDDGVPLPGRLAVRLVHDGTGDSWFDDVAILPTKEEA